MHTQRAVCVAAVLGFCTPAYAQLVQEDRVEALMIASGQPDGMPNVEERLTVTIDGQHAKTTLLQVFENRTGSQTEGRYRLRAGGGSHVDGFAYWNGETKIVGEVFEKQLAREVYENVTTRRRDPGLLEQDGEGAFSFRVFPIQPKEKKRVELQWNRWLDRHGATVRYRAPITRADAEIVISLSGKVKDVTSSTHRLHVEKVSGGVRLRANSARSTGELIVEWQVDEPDWQPSLFVHSGGKNDGWFALALAAPQETAGKVTAKDVTIVVDRSGSMSGEPMEHARAAAADMVRMMGPKDRVNVISFSDEVDPLFKVPQLADAETKEHAIAFINRLKPGGGTDIAFALRTAIKAQDREAGNPRVVVFMTDGQSHVEQAMAAAKADTGDVRMFTVGLGKDVNRPLLSRLAAEKRGRFVYIESASSIEPEVRRLASSIAKPLLVNIEVSVDGAQAVRLYPRSLPDLFAEDEMLVTGRLRGKGTAKFIIKGQLGGKTVSFTKSVDLDKTSPRPWVGGLWAQHRIDHLLEELALGAPDQAEMKNEVLELALAYNVVTPYTSFLAIPESELGAMANTVEAARQRKAKILADNPDAKQLRDDEKYEKERYSVAGGSPGDADEEESEPISSSGRVRGKGCAGCATGGTDGGWIVLVLALVLLRRRRVR